MFKTVAELDAQLTYIQASPQTSGRIVLICARPKSAQRELRQAATFDPVVGLVGDNWSARVDKKTPDGKPNPDKMVTLMSSRVIEALAPGSDHALAGDQLFVDLDLSVSNLPTGTRLVCGEVELEVTSYPHTGCAKFSERFGTDALRWMNQESTRPLRLRGIYARVVRGGSLQVGDHITVARRAQPKTEPSGDLARYNNNDEPPPA